MPAGSQRLPRCFPPPASLLAFDYPVEIAKHASLLVTRYPPAASSWPKVEPDVLGLYAGPTSIAYALYTLRDRLPSPLEGRTPLEWAKAYLAAAQEVASRPDVGPKIRSDVDSSCCGLFSEPLGWAVTAAAVHGEPSYLERLFECAPRVIAAPPLERQKHRSGMALETFDDIDTGRAGYLFHLRFAKAVFPSVAPRVDALVPRVIEAMLQRGPDSTYGWRWVLGHFLGISHGWLGNIVQILVSDPTAERARQCRPWLQQIIRAQKDNGNWGRYLDIPDEKNPDPLKEGDPLVQIGSGAPGVVVGLLAVRTIYAQHGDADLLREIDEAVQQAQGCIWERGLLTKESCISHGAAGNALALLDPGQRDTFLALSVQDEVDRAAEEGSMEPSDSPSDLQRGLAGRLWAMVMLSEGRTGVVPAFNDY